MSNPEYEPQREPSSPSPPLPPANIDWMLHKEKIFLLAQLWQQVKYINKKHLETIHI